MATMITSDNRIIADPIIIGKVDLADPISFAQFLARKGALRLEILGLKRSRGPTVYSLCKQDYDLSGSRQRVHEQMVKIANDVMREIQEAKLDS